MVLQEYGACWNFVPLRIWSLLEFWSFKNMEPAGILVLQEYGACWNFGPSRIWSLLEYGACWNFEEHLTFIDVKFSHNNRKKTAYFISAFPF
jgi:hypothetical protein